MLKTKDFLTEIKPEQLFALSLNTDYEMYQVNKLFFSFRKQHWLEHIKQHSPPNYGYYRREIMLNREGYFFHRTLPNIGLVALTRMAFTVGLMVGIKVEGKSYYQRYCYPTLRDAYNAIECWDGQGLPPGNWIKRKGEGGDLRNPALPKEF